MTEEEMVNRYGSMVYNLSLRLTGNRTEAEDLAQQALVRAIAGWKGFRGENLGGSSSVKTLYTTPGFGVFRAPRKWATRY